MRVRFRRRGAAMIGCLTALAGWPGLALADSAVSSNWSGYVAHRGGVKFRRVSASWRQTSAVCIPGRPAFSSVWVGLGGFSRSSAALEQVGTELDCTAVGQVLSAGWYEVVPQPSRRISMRIRPGDRMQASVQVDRSGVAFQLSDQTTGRSFRQMLKPRRTDTGSADWIVEAPSGCLAPGDCETLPLANFRTITITSARAVTGSGGTGSISSPKWSYTRVLLLTDTGALDPRDRGAAAVPSPLRAGGTAFAVGYVAPGSGLVRRSGSLRTFGGTRATAGAGY